jgi:hypothetical protein
VGVVEDPTSHGRTFLWQAITPINDGAFLDEAEILQSEGLKRGQALPPKAEHPKD